MSRIYIATSALLININNPSPFEDDRINEIRIKSF